MPKREDKPDTVVYAAREPGIHLNGRLEVQEDLIWLNARDNKEQLVSVQLQVKDKIRVQTFILSKTLPEIQYITPQTATLGFSSRFRNHIQGLLLQPYIVSGGKPALLGVIYLTYARCLLYGNIRNDSKQPQYLKLKPPPEYVKGWSHA